MSALATMERPVNEAPVRTKPRPNILLLLVTMEAAWFSASAGTLVVAASYHLASRGGAPSLYYGTFWAGMLLLVAPFSVLVLSKRCSEARQWAAVLCLGVVSFVPKFLRNPYGPVYHDELAHFRAVLDLLTSHRLYSPNPTIPIIADYPGLHIATATIEGLTGLSFWMAASLLMLLVHTATLLAVLKVGQQLLPDARAAGLAAILYGLNPSYGYFDTQFAYESMAICLFLWVVALAATAVRTRGAQRRHELVAAAILILACIVTHHLTTLVLIVLSAILSACHLVFGRWDPGRRNQWKPWVIVLGLAAVGFLLWVLSVAQQTYDYLRPYAGTALNQLAHQFSGAGGGRRLYAGSVQPAYEQLLGVLSPPLLLVAFLVAIRRAHLFDGWPSPRSAIGLSLFGAIYFASVPFILAPLGAEGARRSWGFTYLGVAIPLVALWIHRTRRIHRIPRFRRTYKWLAALALVGLLIGNTGAGLNDAYRFPGPYRFGSDTRSLTTEAISLAQSFGEDHPGSQIVTDRYTGLALAGYGNAYTAIPSPGFRTYDLFLNAADPDPYLVYELSSSGYTYVVVDERLSRYVPLVGNYFEPDEPIGDIGSGKSPIPQAALDRFSQVPWATKVLATSSYSVYRINFTAVGTPSCPVVNCEVPHP